MDGRGRDAHLRALLGHVASVRRVGAGRGRGHGHTADETRGGDPEHGVESAEAHPARACEALCSATPSLRSSELFGGVLYTRVFDPRGTAVVSCSCELRSSRSAIISGRRPASCRSRKGRRRFSASSSGARAKASSTTKRSATLRPRRDASSARARRDGVRGGGGRFFVSSLLLLHVSSRPSSPSPPRFLPRL